MTLLGVTIGSASRVVQFGNTQLIAKSHVFFLPADLFDLQRILENEPSFIARSNDEVVGESVAQAGLTERDVVGRLWFARNRPAL